MEGDAETRGVQGTGNGVVGTCGGFEIHFCGIGRWESFVGEDHGGIVSDVGGCCVRESG